DFIFNFPPAAVPSSGYSAFFAAPCRRTPVYPPRLRFARRDGARGQIKICKKSRPKAYQICGFCAIITLISVFPPSRRKAAAENRGGTRYGYCIAAARRRPDRL